jgi:hypothetical protein
LVIKPVDKQLKSVASSIGEGNELLVGFFEGSCKGSAEEGRVMDKQIEVHIESKCFGTNDDLGKSGVVGSAGD